MGAAVSVTAANITMEWLEQRALNSFSPAPKTFLRYVDDCFSIIKKEALTAFTAHLNGMDEAIKFTVEEEQHGQLPFLDVLVKHEGNSLSFSVYRKSTHTGRYLHFNSVHPASHKRSVVASLVNRVNSVCKKPEDVSADIQRVHGDLSKSGYPDSFVHSVERQLTLPARTDSTRPKKRAPVPYVPGISEHLARVLRPYSVQVAHVPTKKLRHSLVNIKDKLPKEKFPGVVYSIPCADCDRSYVGETGNFPQRLKQHMYDVRKKHVTSNALAEHAEATRHEIDWDNAKIIEKEKNWTSRLLLESLTIQTTEHTLNRNDGNFPHVYTHCLRHILKPT